MTLKARKAKYISFFYLSVYSDSRLSLVHNSWFKSDMIILSTVMMPLKLNEIMKKESNAGMFFRFFNNIGTSWIYPKAPHFFLALGCHPNIKNAIPSALMCITSSFQVHNLPVIFQCNFSQIAPPSLPYFSISVTSKLKNQVYLFPQLQIQNLEREIQEKRRQMRVLEQRIVESGEASVSNASMVEMQQVVLTSI